MSFPNEKFLTQEEEKTFNKSSMKEREKTARLHLVSSMKIEKKIKW